MDDLEPKTVKPILAANLAKEANRYTDEAGHHVKLGASVAGYQFTQHSRDDYVRGIV